MKKNVYGGVGVCRVLVGGSVMTTRKGFCTERHYHACDDKIAKRPDEDLASNGLMRLAFEALNLSHRATLKIVHLHGAMNFFLRSPIRSA